MITSCVMVDVSICGSGLIRHTEDLQPVEQAVKPLSIINRGCNPAHQSYTSANRLYTPGVRRSYTLHRLQWLRFVSGDEDIPPSV